MSKSKLEPKAMLRLWDLAVAAYREASASRSSMYVRSSALWSRYRDIAVDLQWNGMTTPGHVAKGGAL